MLLNRLLVTDPKPDPGGEWYCQFPQAKPQQQYKNKATTWLPSYISLCCPVMAFGGRLGHTHHLLGCSDLQGAWWTADYGQKRQPQVPKLQYPNTQIAQTTTKRAIGSKTWSSRVEIIWEKGADEDVEWWKERQRDQTEVWGETANSPNRLLAHKEF